MTRSALIDYAALASTKAYPRLSKAEEKHHALLWHNDKNRESLERLLIDKSRLVIGKIQHLIAAFSQAQEPEDIHSVAIKGMIKGIDAYASEETERTLNTFVVNGAQWNIEGKTSKYVSKNFNWQGQGRKLLKTAQIEKQGALSTSEEDALLDTISPGLKFFFRARSMGNTIHASDLYRGNQDHPSYDDGQSLTAQGDPMDRYIDPHAVDPFDAIDLPHLKEDIKELLEGLTEREKKVIEMRFGVGIKDFTYTEGQDGCYMTLEEVGFYFGVGKERIRQIEAKALRKMRHPSRSETLRGFLPEDSGSIPENADNTYFERSIEPG